MTKTNHSFDEIDLELLAYVDGFLDRDPVRKANMERRLSQNPDELESVRAYAAQNEALRAAYAQSIKSPTPERLLNIVNGERKFRSSMPAKIAASVVMMLAAGTTGWGLATQQWQEETLAENFIDQIYFQYSNGRDKDGNGSLSTVSAGTPGESWLAPVGFRLAVPDLSDLGYSIVRQEMIEAASGPVTKLTYTTNDGQDFSLYLRARWDERDERMQVRHDGDLSIVLWLDGPVASAVVSKLPTDEAERIARIVRTTMLRRSQIEPILQPQNVQSDKADATHSPTPVNNTAPVLEGATVTDNTTPTAPEQMPTVN